MELFSSPCWATPDPITCSSTIWRVGMIRLMKRAQLVGLRKPVINIAKSNCSLAASQHCTKTDLSLTSQNQNVYSRPQHDICDSWRDSGNLECFSESPSRMLQPTSSHPVFPLFQGSFRTRYKQHEVEWCHQCCYLLPAGRSLILSSGNYLGKWKKIKTKQTYSDVIENRVYLVSDRSVLYWERKCSTDGSSFATPLLFCNNTDTKCPGAHIWS